ncbi:membrane protein [Rhodococcus sp. P27]|nr:membrane protein [Rhodococcus sp. P27]
MPIIRMRARSRDENHRASTPLELFFDLCFVVAAAQAGVQLVHAVAEGHYVDGIAGYMFVFFALWWAWVNFTWFASAYDTDDVPYRIATFVQICGVLVFAAGIPDAFDGTDRTTAIVGYLIMRIALTCQWLRAASGESGAARTTALQYAAGLVIVQAGWIVLLLMPASAWIPGFFVLMIAELAVPAIAERNHQTPWHPQHIAERYGLFTIIMLGETIAAATIAVQSGIRDFDAADLLIPIAVGGVLIVFSALWIYFAVPIHEYLADQGNRAVLLWGYGHYFVFGSAAAIGAGIEVAVEEAVGEAHISTFAASAAVTIPAAMFLIFVWLMHSRHFKRDRIEQAVLPVSAILVLACTFAEHWAVPLAGLVAAGTVGVGVGLSTRSKS